MSEVLDVDRLRQQLKGSHKRLQRLSALKTCRQAWIEVQYAAGGDVAGAALEPGEEGMDHE